MTPIAKPAPLKILVVHEHPALRSQIRICLEDSGYEVIEANSCKQAVDLLHTSEFSAMIVDNDAYDFEAVSPLSERNLTRNSNAPCIVLATNRVFQKPLKHFNAETDDYLFKPFKIAELEKHVRATFNVHHEKSKLTFGSITICRASSTITVNRATSTLPYKQIELLYKLISNSPRVIKKEHFAETLYLPEMKVSQPQQAVESLVFRLRKRLRATNCDVRIKCVRGVGYKASISKR
ncbi:response regulator transcription factor [Metapseudomonas resinovorans]|uniref:response regulator transcription factor n=1 Tax=Metapseudomonas resinovorans TaxID=53412 RepID=UPI0009875EB1